MTMSIEVRPKSPLEGGFRGMSESPPFRGIEGVRIKASVLASG